MKTLFCIRSTKVEKVSYLLNCLSTLLRSSVLPSLNCARCWCIMLSERLGGVSQELLRWKKEKVYILPLLCWTWHWRIALCCHLWKKGFFFRISWTKNLLPTHLAGLTADLVDVHVTQPPEMVCLGILSRY